VELYNSTHRSPPELSFFLYFRYHLRGECKLPFYLKSDVTIKRGTVNMRFTVSQTRQTPKISLKVLIPFPKAMISAGLDVGRGSVMTGSDVFGMCSHEKASNDSQNFRFEQDRR
jgi:hypothetical protein